MIENYCYGDDGFSMQQESYHAMQNIDYNDNYSSVQMMKPSSQYSNQNMTMQSERYGSHQDEFHGNNRYHSGYGGHNVYRNGHPGSAASNGMYMSHTSMGSKPMSHCPMNASHLSYSHSGVGGAGGYNTMMMSSTEYDNYNKVRPGPMMMQTSAMGYENGKWGGGGYHYNHQNMNCMPSNGHHNSAWISKSLDNE